MVRCPLLPGLLFFLTATLPICAGELVDHLPLPGESSSTARRLEAAERAGRGGPVGRGRSGIQPYRRRSWK